MDALVLLEGLIQVGVDHIVLGDPALLGGQLHIVAEDPAQVGIIAHGDGNQNVLEGL